MSTLSNDLRTLISRRLESAGSFELATIVAALCSEDEPDQPMVFSSHEAELPRFELLDKEQALDRTTDLVWTRARSVTTERVNWRAANEAAEGCMIGGHSWRLPTIRELLTLVDYERYDPPIDTDIFACASSWYWTATPYAPSPGDFAWLVNFNDGSADWLVRDYDGFVRAVRASEYPTEVSLRDLHAAWLEARRGKQPSASQLQFEAFWIDNLLELQGRRHVRRGFVVATPAEYRALRSTWMSYVGHMSHAASGRLISRLHREFPWLRRALLTRRFRPELEGERVALSLGSMEFPQ